MLTINDFGIIRTIGIKIGYPISQFSQGFFNNSKCISLVVAFQIFDIFKHKCRWLFSIDNTSNVKEQGSLSLAFKAMSTAKGVLFGYTC